MQPLKLMRQRSYALAADQVCNLSSVQVESPSHAPSALSFCSACAPTAVGDASSASAQRARQRRMIMWRQRAEDCLWVASAFFILYYGDFRSDFFTVLASDGRVWRMPFHMGLACLMMDSCMVMVYIVADMASPQQEQQEEESSRQLLQATGVIQAIAMLGSLAFILLSLALWPIWNFLTIPMLFTLFMAVTVVLPYILPPDVKILKLNSGCAT